MSERKHIYEAGTKCWCGEPAPPVRKEASNMADRLLNKFIEREKRLQARVEALEKALEIPLDDVGRIMHESWSKTKRAQGFHHPFEAHVGAKFYHAKICDKCHPDLVPWAELPEAQKDINRHAFDAVLEEIHKRAKGEAARKLLESK